MQWLWGSTFRFFCRVTGKARNRVGLENVGRVEKFERRVVFVFRSLGIVGTREEAVLCCVFVYNRHFRLLSDKWPTEFEGRGSRFPDTGNQPVSARTHALSGAKQQSSSRSAEGGNAFRRGWRQVGEVGIYHAACSHYSTSCFKRAQQDPLCPISSRMRGRKKVRRRQLPIFYVQVPRTLQEQRDHQISDGHCRAVAAVIAILFILDGPLLLLRP